MVTGITKTQNRAQPDIQAGLCFFTLTLPLSQQRQCLYFPKNMLFPDKKLHKYEIFDIFGLK